MKKIFVLDTNVLLHNPDAINSFGDNIVVLPVEVLEELDKFKKNHDEKGRNSRVVIRNLDKLRQDGSLQSGVNLDNGGILQIISNINYEVFNSYGLDLSVTDNRLLITACLLQKYNESPVIFVSKDINARVKADSLGITSQDFEKQKVNIDELYTGWRKMETDRYPQQIDDGIDWSGEKPLHPNEFVMVEPKSDQGKHIITRFDKSTKKLYPLLNDTESMWGISARNPQQQMACELLLDPKVELISLVGQAGTGKTLLALAAGLYMVVEKKCYDRLLISRPIVPLGNDLGFLPGSKEDKLENWMEPIFDNLEFILSVYRKRTKHHTMTIRDLVSSGVIQLEALTYMRGRSIPRQYIIIDEAQNLSPHEIKTVVTRMGLNAKMVITGDPYQIGSPYLDSDSNGLTYCVERLKNETVFGHVTLEQSERGHLASIAAKLL